MSAHHPRTVVVRRRLRATPEALLATLADPDSLARVRGVSSVTVSWPGAEGPASVGTVRRVELLGGAFLTEEIVDLDPAGRFDYLIVDASIPFDHQFGRIEFRRAGERTLATWTTTYAVRSAALSTLLTRASGPAVHAAFHTALGALDAQAAKELTR